MSNSFSEGLSGGRPTMQRNGTNPRFCGQEFQLDRFDPQVHLSNNSVQKNYKNGERSEHLPENNMWSSDEFKSFLKEQGKENVWEDILYPGMKQAIIAVLISSQESLEYRKNSFELYGADFMIGEDMQPWLIEINSSPALGPSTHVTERLCRNVLEDTLKVVLDRRENRDADTGRFELAYRRPYISMPSYVGCTIAIDGIPLKPVTIAKKKSAIAPKPPTTTKSPSPPPAKTNDDGSAEAPVTKGASPCKIPSKGLGITPCNASSNSSSNESLVVNGEKKKTTCVGNKGDNSITPILPVVKYSSKKEKSGSTINKPTNTTDTSSLTTKRHKQGAILSNAKGKVKVSKSKSHHEKTEILRALIEPRLCTFPLDTTLNVEVFQEMRNSHPSYRLSKPIKLGPECDDVIENSGGVKGEKMCSSLEFFQPYHLRYRNIQATSLSRQFSLMTAEDVEKLKKRRWNASVPS